MESVNLKGLRQVQKCLKEYFNIASKITSRKSRNTHLIYIFSKENLEKFRKNIGFLHDAKKQKLDDAIDSFIDYTWKFPKLDRKLTKFVKSKMKERAKIHKPGYVQMCSIVENNLLQLKNALSELFSIKSNVYGPRKNKHGTIYYEFTIARKSEIQKIVKNDLLSEEQKKKLAHLKNQTSTTH